MAAQRGSGPSDGAVFGVLLLLCLMVGFIITYFWWFVAGLAIVAFVVGSYVMVHRAERRWLREVEQQASQEFDRLRRAERQKRWTLIGDPRAIYGEGGTVRTESHTSGSRQLL